MALYRVKARWTGFTGAPGLSVFHFHDESNFASATPAAAAAAVRAFFQANVALLPGGVTISVENQVELINEGSGELEDIVGIATQTPTTGTATAGFSAPSGVVVHWLTNGVRNGRRVRGKTFLVPQVGSIYQADGTIANAFIGNYTTAAQALIDDPASAFVVYGRPTQGGTDGQAFLVTGTRVPDMVAVLRSRRD